MRTLVALLLFTATASAETVCLRYGPCPLDLSSFKCADVERMIRKVLTEECSGNCLDVERERRKVARAVYEMLCHEGFVYLDYDTVSDNAE